VGASSRGQPPRRSRRASKRCCTPRGMSGHSRTEGGVSGVMSLARDHAPTSGPPNPPQAMAALERADPTNRGVPATLIRLEDRGRAPASELRRARAQHPAALRDRTDVCSSVRVGALEPSRSSLASSLASPLSLTRTAASIRPMVRSSSSRSKSIGVAGSRSLLSVLRATAAMIFVAAKSWRSR